MNEKNFDWDNLQLFLAVARAGGLSAASAVTGKSAPTLGRRMIALEEQTGEELFVRLARGYSLTEQGHALFDKLVSLEAEILPLKRVDHTNQPVTVKISAGSWMTYVLCQNVTTLLAGNDSTRLRFISAEHSLDISRRETVIGIRNYRPQTRGLASRKMGQVHFAGYAVNEEIKNWIRVLGETPSSEWLAAQDQKEMSIEVTAPRNALDLATAGIARVLLPTFIGEAQPKLIQVTSAIKSLTHDQWLVTHQDERFKPEVRKTIDRVYEVIDRIQAFK